VNLQRRLERLAPLTAAVSSRAAEERVALPPIAERQRALSELRTRIGEVLARSTLGNASLLGLVREEAPRRERVSLRSLAFQSTATSRGEIELRTERLPIAHSVGRISLQSLAGACSETISHLALDPRLAAAHPEGWLFLDLETTGLGGAGVMAFVVGMARLEQDGYLRVEQLVLGEPDREAALLHYVRERYAAASLIVTYNGKSFDRPMLEGRCAMNRMPPLPDRPQLDLLHVVRRLHQRRLGRCSLKRIESEVLGFDRGDDIDGSEVAVRYGQYLRSGDAAGLRDVVDHNFSDVLSMAALAGLYGQQSPELPGEDLAGLARTLERAGARGDAERAAEQACQRGGGIEALRVRAELAKARGDTWAAVRDFEQLCRHADDPRGRLELAKLYEHHVKRPALALRCVARGTGESPSDLLRRRRRLERKLEAEVTRGPEAVLPRG
jgi:uncharacterized protein YprB with RNaseH-like and TPR domain